MIIQMFRWILKPKFYSKCISYVKCIKIRLERIEKKRRAVEKFTKSDIAELLRRGLDYDAYKRAEGLLFEQKMLSCYELIEKFIGCISDHLEDITKQSECPEECKEAVPSLMYAAARISDLPELRDLRTLFIEKYGNSLEPYINKEIVEKLRRDPSTREMKIRLLYDIAQEFSIDWNAKALMKRLYTHPSLYEGRPMSDNNRDNIVNIGGGEHQYSSDYDDDETSTDTSSHHGRKDSSSSFGSISEDDHQKVAQEIKKPNSFLLIPPPYLKQNANNNKSEINSNKTTNLETLQKTDSSGMKPSTSDDTISSSQGLAQIPGGAWRVPTTLPDYDDLIARLKAFTGRS
ncbi:uncharacterized protein [Cicer arietinum]|uniref:Uncharacterized protein LOC101512015 isoform X2 n=1 Tax=Cicer arietinum TaxID=3827 RepID=A0A1S3ECG2_CICAR|nr:uncharacterized protein LOC101512015 isoform X2 [Cicer arietinum]